MLNLLYHVMSLQVFDVTDDAIEFHKPHDVTAIRIYPVDTSGIIHFRMPGIIECLAEEWSNID